MISNRKHLYNQSTNQPLWQNSGGNVVNSVRYEDQLYTSLCLFYNEKHKTHSWAINLSYSNSKYKNNKLYCFA